MDFKKRLYRSRTDRRFFGVCGGLGDYFSIDPILFRLAFVMAVLFFGFGIGVYLIMWLVIPEEPLQ